MNMDIYNLLDIYADRNDIDKAEALHQWYRGNISERDLITAYLNEEGIFGYTNEIIKVFAILQEKSIEPIKNW